MGVWKLPDKTQKRSLGSGLSALFGDADAGSGLDGALFVKTERVEPREGQPRHHFDEEALSVLADSIARHGMLQPITVRRLPNGYYQIIAGERRWRAARLAGLQTVPVRVMTADDRRTAELALVENLQREDLNPVEEARGYAKLMEEYGLTQDETAQSVGKSRPAIANSLRLLGLPMEVIGLLEDGSLSAGHARALLAIHDERTCIASAKKAVAESLSVRQTERLAAKIAENLAREVASEPQQNLIVDYTAEAEKQLTGALGRKVIIKDGKKRGKIELEYYGADDREALISTLLRLKK
ncbi:MAG: ParB/RepB/Spo0J family partition protein [Oscillospiraceae bacterium]|nr:ParB/RepB/Spo0J family partition protein [Oscillospiraceae bacterium]